MFSLTKPEKCIVMRGGMQHWVSLETANKVVQIINAGVKGMVEIKEIDAHINPADISGIYSPKAMETHTRQKNGEWQCKYGNWHQRGSQCECGRMVNTFKEPKVVRASQSSVDMVRETINKLRGK